MSDRSPPDKQPNQPPKKKAHLLGIGLDNEDGHKRITKADDFSIVGGSEQTHEQMTETLVRTMEDIQRKGKRLPEVESEELRDLIQKNAEKSG